MSASEQARADAMADAETLRIEAWRYPKDFRTALESAGIFGNGARAKTHTSARAAASCATSAARAAFRAVPGLRGDATR